MNSGHKNIAEKILVDGKRNWRRRNVSGTQKRLEGKILVECKRGWSRPPAPKPGGDPNRALGCRPGSVTCTGVGPTGAGRPGVATTPHHYHARHPWHPTPHTKKIKEIFFTKIYASCWYTMCYPYPYNPLPPNPWHTSNHWHTTTWLLI